MLKKIACYSVMILVAMVFFLYKFNLYSHILGKYDRGGYNFFTLIYEFPHEEKTFLENIPGSIKNAYEAQGVNLNTLKNIKTSIKIWGPVLEKGKKPADREYNVAFHPEVMAWSGRSEADLMNTNVNIDQNVFMGIFEPNGIVVAGSAPIAFGNFTVQNVNKHDVHFSPDNARFKIQEQRKIATFWTAALSQDKQNAAIGFNIILDDDGLEKIYQQKLLIMKEGEDQVIYMLDALKELISYTQGADTQALQKGIAIIERLLSAQEEFYSAREQFSESENDFGSDFISNYSEFIEIFGFVDNYDELVTILRLYTKQSLKQLKKYMQENNLQNTVLFGTLESILTN